ncbi:uncharacterized protein C8orf58 homolog isoform X11 [Tursiops truncatus]|uniref:Uncharacterized protein C8orf58 homolog isoform X9 n=1 Tax=Tursiops truncatus TaxID=9739 RepID=A0A2U4BFE6_TURTR|nr:uncharacterized protein C8orf58 homolog isoform X9 [Tursiops truncatus]
MLGRRRVFAVEPLGGRDGAGEDLARGCVVPGVTSTYRRIPDAAPGWSADSCKGHGRLRAPGRQVPLLKLASQDSGVEMAVGDRSLATSPGLSQDSLNSEPMQNAEPLALGATEPPARLSRLLASRKLEQVLERSRQLPTSSASLSHYRSPKPPSHPEYEMPLFGAGGQEATKAESDLEAGLEEAEVGRVFATWNTCAWYWSRWRDCSSSACSCRLRGPLGILKRRSRPWRLHLHPLTPRAVRYTGGGSGSARQRRQRDLSHWNKVKVLLNRIRWRSPRPAEAAAPPDGSAPRIASRDLPERPPGQTLQKTFMPSLVVKKQRAKNLTVC